MNQLNQTKRIPLVSLAGASLLALSFTALAWPVAARADGACPEPSSLSGSFQAKAVSQALSAWTVASPSVSGGKIVVSQDTKKSWVNTNLVTLNGKRSGSTTKTVKDCQATFKKKTSYRWKPNPACPAAAANSSAKEATSQGECESVIGAGIDADASKEEARLLQHERYHVRLACAVANQGNQKIVGGAKAANVLAAVKSAITKHQAQYDRDTTHGCKGDKQSGWETRIDDSSAKWLP